MAVATKVLAIGVVSSAGDSLLYAPSAITPKKCAVVKGLRLVNNQESALTLNVSFLEDNGSVKKRILPKDSKRLRMHA